MDRPLNILTLASFFPHTAAPSFGIFIERQTAELASRSGVRVTVINPTGMPPWPLSCAAAYAALRGVPEQESWHSLTVHRPRFTLIPGIGGPFNPRMIARAVLPLARRLHAERPFDLIDAEFFYPDGPAAMRIARALHIPFTVKARGSDIHYWGRARGCAGQIADAANNAAGLLAVSQALKDDMVAIGMAAEKIRVHYTGLDQQTFRPVDRPAAKAALGISGPLIICVGALIPRKRQDLLIQSLSSLPGATLLLVGKGTAEGNLRQLARKLNVADRVHFAGAIPHAQLPALIGAADVLALVSQSEGLANAWVEGLACGTPIVISQAGGARELLRSPAAGAIVRPDPAEIATAISRILANPPSQEEVRAQVAHFSWRANGDQLVEFFRSIARRTAQP